MDENEFNDSPTTTNQSEAENEQFYGENGSEDGSEETGTETGETGQETDEGSLLEEIEFDGKKYTLPPELKDALLRQADYTRKTQEVAAERQAVATQINMLREAQQLSEATREIDMQEKIVTSLLEQYQGVDWQQFQQMNPQAAMAEYIKYQQLKESASGIESKRAELINMFGERTAGEKKAMLEMAQRDVKRFVPNYTPAYGAEVAKYARNQLKISPAIMDMANTSPELFGLLHKAYQHDKLAAKQAGNSNRPTALRGASASRVNDPLGDRIKSADEWAKWELKRMANKGRK